MENLALFHLASRLKVLTLDCICLEKVGIGKTAVSAEVSVGEKCDLSVMKQNQPF
jgi:hypothetical protein